MTGPDTFPFQIEWIRWTNRRNEKKKNEAKFWSVHENKNNWSGRMGACLWSTSDVFLWFWVLCLPNAECRMPNAIHRLIYTTKLDGSKL